MYTLNFFVFHECTHNKWSNYFCSTVARIVVSDYMYSQYFTVFKKKKYILQYPGTQVFHLRNESICNDHYIDKCQCCERHDRLRWECQLNVVLLL